MNFSANELFSQWIFQPTFILFISFQKALQILCFWSEYLKFEIIVYASLILFVWFKCRMFFTQNIHHHDHYVALSARISQTPLSPPLPIIHCFQQVFRATSPYQHRAAEWKFLLVILPELIPTSPAVSRMSGSSDLDSFQDGWLVTTQLLLCRVLPPELVQYCSHHSCVELPSSFSWINLVSVHVVHPLQQYRYNHCLEKTAFHFINQVWLPYDPIAYR